MEAARHCASRFRSKSTDLRPVDFALGSQRDAHAGKLNLPSPSRCLTRPFRPRSSTKPHADNVFIRLAGLPVAVGRRIEVTAQTWAGCGSGVRETSSPTMPARLS